MKKVAVLGAFLAISAAAPAIAESVDNSTLVVTADTASDVIDVAYPQLASGHNLAAVDRLRDAERDPAADPSRLINLGAAYARLGRTADAAKVLRMAAASDRRYDVELADGRNMDSRTASRLALHAIENGQQFAGLR
jgi:Flp pilus assembly protein TadD